MKITFLLHSFCIGGVEKVTINLANELAKNEIVTEIIVLEDKGELKEYINPNVVIRNLNSKRARYCILKLAKYLHTEKPNWLILPKEYLAILGIISKYLFLSRTKILICFHTNLSTHTKYSKSSFEKVIPYILRLLLPIVSDEIVAVSESIADDVSSFLRIKRKKLKVIYNPVVSQELYIKSLERIDHPWFIKDTIPIIITIARLTKAKNIPLLIEAFHLIRKKRNVRLVIIGEGEEREKIEGLVEKLGIREDVWLAGSKRNPLPYLARSRLFVLSSIWEGLPTSIIEALALGIPVVATNCVGGIREILENEEYGLLVHREDKEMLAKKILLLLDQNVDKGRLQERASVFSVDNAANKYLELFNK